MISTFPTLTGTTVKLEQMPGQRDVLLTRQDNHCFPQVTVSICKNIRDEQPRHLDQKQVRNINSTRNTITTTSSRMQRTVCRQAQTSNDDSCDTRSVGEYVHIIPWLAGHNNIMNKYGRADIAIECYGEQSIAIITSQRWCFEARLTISISPRSLSNDSQQDFNRIFHRQCPRKFQTKAWR